jgi:hypothetical protein
VGRLPKTCLRKSSEVQSLLDSESSQDEGALIAPAKNRRRPEKPLSAFAGIVPQFPDGPS